MLNIHHLHDEASIALAEKLCEWIEGVRMIPEPVDDLGWSGVRLFDERSQSWVTSVKWVRGRDRDLDATASQIAMAVEQHRSGELGQPRTFERICGDLGIDYNSVRTRVNWSRRQQKKEDSEPGALNVEAKEIE